MTKIIKAVGLLTILSFLVLPTLALAQDGVDVWGSPEIEAEVKTEGGWTDTKDIRVVIATIIRTAMGFLGIVAVVIILIGGFKWMTAGGSEEKVGEAKKLIIAGVIGLAIVLAAYAIASFVINTLVGAVQ